MLGGLVLTETVAGIVEARCALLLGIQNLSGALDAEVVVAGSVFTPP